MKPRVRKLPILLPVLLVIALLAAAAVKIYLERDSEVSHTDLGEKYLNSMDYSGAAMEFMAGLTENPTDTSARIGLAQAYLAMGETELVSDVLQPLTDRQHPDSYRILVQMESQSQDVHQALLTAQKLVEQTDEEADYALRDQLLQQVLVQPHRYACGTDQTLMITDGQLKSAGSNVLGQLGCREQLASEQQRERFGSAEFTGTADRVYCAGRTSFVVDAQGNLWAAGENRWGQMGTGEITMTVQPGWKKIVSTGDVASVAGTTGRLYLLKTDGTLWFAGQGGSMELTRVPNLLAVTSLDANDEAVAVLTIDGRLYRCTDGNTWQSVARNVKQFSLCQSALVWVTADNRIGSSNYSFQTPENWTQDKAGAAPDFKVMRVAADANGILLQGADGVLRRLYRGTVDTYEGVNAVAVYSVGGHVVVETGKGGLLCWNLSEDAPVTPKGHGI